MTQIKHEESYYIGALKSSGIDPATLTHRELALNKAIMHQIEADLMIEASKGEPITSKNDFDYSNLLKSNKK